MAINSKQKGNKAERDATKWWQSWTGFEFSRVPASGGLRWKKTDNITSDIICTDDKHSRKFPFSIEIKCYKDINFEHVLLGKKTSQIDRFWAQAVSDSKRAERIPVLMMRYNGMSKGEWFFCVDEKVSKILMEDHSLQYLAINTQEVKLAAFKASEILSNVVYKKLRRRLK